MAINPDQYTISYDQLIKNTTIRDRASMVQNDNSFYAQLMQALTPTQMANLFPRYYRDRLPDIGGFNLATSQIAAGTFGKGLPTSTISTEAPTSTVSTRKKKGRDEIAAGGDKTGQTDKKRIDEYLKENGIDVKTIYNLLKQGTSMNDPRLKGLSKLPKEELSKIGLKVTEDDVTGRAIVKAEAAPVEKMTDKQLKEEMKKASYGSKAGLSEKSALIDFKSKKLKEALGIDDRQYNAYRQGIANKESDGGNYNILRGGAGGNYTGAYQFGDAAMKDAARILGVEVPTKEEFNNNPELQEAFLDAFTYANHKTLMQSDAYKKMSPEEKLAALAYAHNQGGGGALEYLKTGIPGVDGFGTPGTAFSESVLQQLEATKDQKVFDPNKEYTPEEIAQYKEEQTAAYEKQKMDELTQMYVDQGMQEGPTATQAKYYSEKDPRQFYQGNKAVEADDEIWNYVHPDLARDRDRIYAGGGKIRTGAILAADAAFRYAATKGVPMRVAIKGGVDEHSANHLQDGIGEALDIKPGKRDANGRDVGSSDTWKEYDLNPLDIATIGAATIQSLGGTARIGVTNDYHGTHLQDTGNEGLGVHEKYGGMSWSYGGDPHGAGRGGKFREQLQSGYFGKEYADVVDSLYEPETKEKSAPVAEADVQPEETKTPPSTETSSPYAGKSMEELQTMLSDEIARGDTLADGSAESYASQKKRGELINAIEQQKASNETPVEPEAATPTKSIEELQVEYLEQKGIGLNLPDDMPQEEKDAHRKKVDDLKKQIEDLSAAPEQTAEPVKEEPEQPAAEVTTKTEGANGSVQLAEGGVIKAKDDLKVVRKDGSPTGIEVGSKETAVIIPADEKRQARDIVPLDGTGQRDATVDMDEEVLNSKPIEAPLNQAKMSTGAYQPSNLSTVPTSHGIIEYSPSALRALGQNRYVDNHGYHGAPRTIYTQK